MVSSESWKSLIERWTGQLHLSLLICLVAPLGYFCSRATALANESNVQLGTPDLVPAVANFDRDSLLHPVRVQALASTPSPAIHNVGIWVSSSRQHSPKVAALPGSLRIARRNVKGDLRRVPQKSKRLTRQPPRQTGVDAIPSQSPAKEVSEKESLSIWKRFQPTVEVHDVSRKDESSDI